MATLALIVSLSAMGIPLPAHAGEEPPPLTLNGRPLSQLLNRGAAGATLSLAGLLEQETGQISGVAVDGEGQPLARQRVQLKSFVGVGPRRHEQVVARDTTDAEGRFSFAELEAGEFFVELLIDNDVALSAPHTLTEGAMQVRGVTVSYDGGMSTGAKVALYSGAAAGAVLFGYVLACNGSDRC